MNALCRICKAKSDAFLQASKIAAGVDDGTADDYGITPCPDLAALFEHKAAMHGRASCNHGDSHHD